MVRRRAPRRGNEQQQQQQKVQYGVTEEKRQRFHATRSHRFYLSRSRAMAGRTDGPGSNSVNSERTVNNGRKKKRLEIEKGSFPRRDQLTSYLSGQVSECMFSYVNRWVRQGRIQVEINHGRWCFCGNDHFSLQMRVFFSPPLSSSQLHAASEKAAMRRFGGMVGWSRLSSTMSCMQRQAPALRAGG